MVSALNDVTLNVPDLVDLERYPIDQLGSREGQALVQRCRAELAETNSCVLTGFIKEDAITTLQEEADRLAVQAFFYEKGGLNCYRTEDDSRFPADHPRRMFFSVYEGVVAYDQFSIDSSLREIYLWQPVSDFLAQCFEKDALYPFGDPFQALNILVVKENADEQGMGWHFDENEFTITLMVQPPEAGGEFEYVPNIRTPWDENYRGVQAILNGDREGIRSEPPRPGMLALFRGGFSLHRVAPVRGNRDRLQCIMTFEKQPGERGSDESNAQIYGRRVAKILAEKDA
jgi:hypothetical protein